MVHAAQPDGLLGHAKDHATQLVLGDGLGAGVLEGQHTFCAVAAHAGHNDGNGLLAGQLGHGLEQHLHGRALAGDLGPLIEFGHPAGPVLGQHHVLAPGGHQGAAGQHRVAVRGLLHLKWAEGIEALGERAREAFKRGEQQLLNTIAALTANTVRAVQLSDELRRSRRRIVTAREDERRRLRRDLHDGLGPQLASQTLGLEAVAQLMPANPEKAQALLSSLKIQAQEAMLDVRRLVYDLRPPALDDLGLIGALKQSASRYATGELRFSFDVPQTLPELPAAVETAAYRIAQEAMTNVVRHAGATLCTVRLSSRDAHLIVEIRDNGRGLSPDRTCGVGLQAMKERATELNGQFRLESLPDGGTLVQARLPLEVYDE